MLRIQIPDNEENIVDNADVVDGSKVQNNIGLVLSIVCLVAVIVLSSVFIISTGSVAQTTEEEIKSTFGPFDMLGQKLMTSSIDDDFYIFDVEEQPEEAKASAVEPEIETPEIPNPLDPIVEDLLIDTSEKPIIMSEMESEPVNDFSNQNIDIPMQTEKPSQNEQVLDVVPVVGENIQPIESQNTLSIAELQRQAEEQIIAQSREKQIKANAESDISRRSAVQQAQAAEAKLKAQADADYLYSLTHPQHRRFYSSIAIAGEVVKWISDVDDTPEELAGAWVGTGDVLDCKGTYFIGHNPGVFHMLIDSNVGLGDIISVWDSAGYAKAYTVDDIFVIDAGTVFDLEMQKRTVYSGGECIALQTCIDDGKRYKVFVAH